MSPQVRTQQRDPFSVQLSPEESADLVRWLSEEIEGALAARDRLIGDGQLIDYWRTLYKQGRTRTSKDRPWPGAADLTSYLGTEKVDTLRSAVVDAVFVEPVWAVEGQGEDAARAPLVEEFHQWVVETKERLQARLSKAIHNSLIEKVGILETYEKSDIIKTQTKQAVRVETDPATGLPVLDANLNPQPVLDEGGAFVPAQPGEASVEIVQEDRRPISLGPRHRVIAIRDFVVLPGHAADKDDIWGYAKRVWIRRPVLQARQKDGIYRHVDQLPEGEERALSVEQRQGGQELAAQRGPSAEKEIWEVNIKTDLDHDGYEEWYKVTLSITHKVLLRCQRDDLNVSPYSLFIPFPDPDSAWCGLGYIGDKLWTLIEEHTSLRNMAADRSAVKTNLPLMVRDGCPWDLENEPIGPGQRIRVRDASDVQPLDMPDVPASMIEQKRDVVEAADLISGVPRMMSGAQSETQRTLGENQMVMGGASMRAKEVVRNIQETLEELGALRHLMWQRALASQSQGLPAPASVVEALAYRGIEAELTDGRFTADLLRGQFLFKPRGSVETADPNRQKQDFNTFLAVLAALSKANPAYAMWMGHPKTIKALASYAVRLFKFPDRGAMLEALTEVLTQQAQQQQMAQQAAAMGQPTLPGGPPAPGGPLPPGPPPMSGGAASAPPIGALLQAVQARMGAPTPPPAA